MSDTSTPSSRIRPEVGCSKPAISRRVVVLPQPDGPSREKNSPLAPVGWLWRPPSSLTPLSARAAWFLRLPPHHPLLPLLSFLPQLPSAFARPPDRGRGLPPESKLPGREPHRKIVRALRRHRRVIQCDLYRKPVEQGGQRDREIVRVNG